MLIAFTSNLFCNYTVEQHMFESLQWIVMAGLGFTASEKFSEILNKRKNQNQSKKVYTIVGNRYGGEITIGKVSQEFCDYWKNMDQEELESYIIDGWEDNEDDSIPNMIDGEDKYWHDLDDILHFYGSHAEGNLTLIDTDTEEEKEVDYQFLWGREGGFFDTEEPDWDNLYAESSLKRITCL